jgi:adenylylsulfate kinase
MRVRGNGGERQVRPILAGGAARPSGRPAPSREVRWRNRDKSRVLQRAVPDQGSESGFCLWLTGLPSSGKTTLARELSAQLRQQGFATELLDGDEVRRGLSADLGFDRASREAHAVRVAYVAKLLVRHGVIPIVALISPYRRSRASARSEIGPFVEVYVSTPLSVCESRDVKGLYRRARAGEIKEMTGVDDPYEAPESPDIVVDTSTAGPADTAAELVHELFRQGWLSRVGKVSWDSGKLPARLAPGSGRAPGRS